MKSFSIFGLLLAVLLAASPVSAQTTVTEVLGANAACDPDIDTCLFFPAGGAVLCNGGGAILNCPQWFHPDWSQAPGTRFFGVTNRLNPPIYVLSTDGGTTFSALATQPFVAAVLNLGGKVAVASDGSFLAAAGQGANTCIIRRSTDQGANWTTVFTHATRQCTNPFGSPTAPGMACEATGGYCAVIDPFNAATIFTIFSTDNGANWSVGATGAAILSADSTAYGPAHDSSGGVDVVMRGINSLIGAPFANKAGGDFVITANYTPVANQNCRPLFMNGQFRAICSLNAGGPTYHSVFAGAVPAALGTFTVSPNPTTLTHLPVGYGGGIGYLILPEIAFPNRLKVYITLDDWTSIVNIANLTTTTAVIAGCCRGNAIRWGSKIYFSSGGTATQAFLAVIQ